MQSFKIPSSEIPGYSATYRHPEYKDGTQGDAFTDITTLYELFQHLVDKYPKREFLGTRKLRSWLKAPSFGKYEWMTVLEAGEFVEEFGSGLDHIYTEYTAKDGAVDSSQQQPLGIMSTNRPEWLLTELAGFRSQRFSVGIDDNIDVVSAEYTINHSNTAVLVCSLDKIPRLLERIKETPGIKVIISMDKLDCSQRNVSTLAFNAKHVIELKARAESLGVAMLDIDKVRQMGRDSPTTPSPPSPSDIFTTTYTSGTTGAQKGVMLSHGGHVHATRAYCLEYKLKDETYLSFKPMVHILDRTTIYAFFYNYGRVGFFSGDKTKVMDDIRELKPTSIATVPLVLNRIYEHATAATIGAKGIVGLLSRAGFKSKTKRINSGRGAKHALWDRLIFDKVADIFGGRVKNLISVAAPIKTEVLEFFRAALCCNVVQLYCQTEGSGACMGQICGDTTVDNVGVPLPGIDVRLRSIADMGYHVTDAVNPRGEIMMRGKNVFSQYLKNPETTKETMDGEWLATGDIAQINPDGTFSIIDRVKNMVKTGQGKWIALERIEDIYAWHPLVQSVFAHGNWLQRDLVAIVVPKAESFVPWARSIVKSGKGDPKPTLSNLCANEEVLDALQQELKNYAVAKGLALPEHISAIYCEPSTFEARASTFLTSTSKIRRRVVQEHYQDKIDSMFAKLDNSINPTPQEV